jgi:lipopolysaccharide/colanic/teichoic acid biosynthesis glycosyltransferase
LLINPLQPAANRSTPLRLNRTHCLTLLVLLDLGFAGAATLGVGFAVGAIKGGLWLASCLSAWALTRNTRRTLALDSYSRAALVPLTALLLSVLLILGHGGHVVWPVFLGAATGWQLWMGVSRYVLRHLAAPVLLGVIGHPNRPPYHPGIQYLPLTSADAGPISHLNGLLIGAEAYSQDWVPLLEHAQAAGMPVWTAAQLVEETHGQINVEALLKDRLQVSDYRGGYLKIKRLCDLLTTLLLLPVLLPIMLVVAALVLIDAGWPVLFFQARVGEQGRVFRIAKFRTMRRNSEAGGAVFASAGDVRVTRLGRLLRKFRLDELPQFWNVLRGDMSIIGPRPEQEQFVQNFEQDLYLYAVRHWVKPGITGWAQVTQGYAATADESALKLKHDVYYIKHVSFALDARIVVRTLLTILTGFGAR